MSIFGFITNEQMSYSKHNALLDISFNKERGWNNDFKALFKGYLGEVVFADYYGLDRPEAFRGLKPAWDFSVNGLKVDIKASGFVNVKTSGLRVSVENYKEYIDLYVFVLLNERVGNFHIIGYTSPDELEFEGGFYKKCWDELFPIEDIFSKYDIEGYCLNVKHCKQSILL